MAFATSSTLNTSSFTTTNRSSSLCARRRPSLKSTNIVTPKMSGAGNTIDFGKIDITQTSNMAGLVFTPEATSDSIVDTRVDLSYTQEQVDAVNAHINVEYTASYAYHAIWAYFNRDTVALPGFAHYFSEQSKEEREHAEEFMAYQNSRGGKVELQPIAVPDMSFTQDDGTSDALYAMDLHLQLEKFVYYKLKDLHKIAERNDDAQMQDFVEEYMSHQVEAVKKAGDYIAQLKRVGTPHGVYHFDRVLLGEENCAAQA